MKIEKLCEYLVNFGLLKADDLISFLKINSQISQNKYNDKEQLILTLFSYLASVSKNEQQLYNISKNIIESFLSRQAIIGQLTKKVNTQIYENEFDKNNQLLRSANNYKSMDKRNLNIFPMKKGKTNKKNNLNNMDNISFEEGKEFTFSPKNNRPKSNRIRNRSNNFPYRYDIDYDGNLFNKNLKIKNKNLYNDNKINNEIDKLYDYYSRQNFEKNYNSPNYNIFNIRDFYQKEENHVKKVEDKIMKLTMKQLKELEQACTFSPKIHDIPDYILKNKINNNYFGTGSTYDNNYYNMNNIRYINDLPYHKIIDEYTMDYYDIPLDNTKKNNKSSLGNSKEISFGGNLSNKNNFVIKPNFSFSDKEKEENDMKLLNDLKKRFTNGAPTQKRNSTNSKSKQKNSISKDKKSEENKSKTSSNKPNDKESKNSVSNQSQKKDIEKNEENNINNEEQIEKNDNIEDNNNNSSKKTDNNNEKINTSSNKTDNEKNNTSSNKTDNEKNNISSNKTDNEKNNSSIKTDNINEKNDNNSKSNKTNTKKSNNSSKSNQTNIKKSNNSSSINKNNTKKSNNSSSINKTNTKKSNNSSSINKTNTKKSNNSSNINKTNNEKKNSIKNTNNNSKSEKEENNISSKRSESKNTGKNNTSSIRSKSITEEKISIKVSKNKIEDRKKSLPLKDQIKPQKKINESQNDTNEPNNLPLLNEQIKIEVKTNKEELSISDNKNKGNEGEKQDKGIAKKDKKENNMKESVENNKDNKETNGEEKKFSTIQDIITSK